MKRIVLILILVFLFLDSQSQNEVKGKVTDAAGEILIGVSVYLPELSKGTITNTEGEYHISELPIGHNKIQFSFLGFNTELKNIMIGKEMLILNIQLTEAVMQFEEVVVSGAKVSSQHDNAIKIEILDSKKLLFAGTPNMMESISDVPGVDMISKGPGVSKPVIRGLSMNDILVLNNGVRMENYQYSENHPIGINESSIARIEIIKGPASLLYGSDAIGGVLNFIKENPASRGTIEGNYNMQLFSNTKGISNNLGIKGANKHFFAGINIGNKSNADYLQGGGDFVPNTRFNELSLNANIGYTGKRAVYKIYYDIFKQKLGMSVPPVKPFVLEQGRKNDIWYQDLDHQLLSSKNTFYFNKLKWTVDLAYQDALRKLITTSEAPTVEMKLNTFTYDSKIYYTVNQKLEYIIGIQGMLQENKNLNNRKSQFLPNANINSLGAVALLQYKLLSNLQVQTGLRYDIHKTETDALGIVGTGHYAEALNKTYDNFSASLGLTYSPFEKINFRLNLAKAYRVPNLSELTSNGMHGNRYELGNPNLLPQDSYEADLSMHYHAKTLSFDFAVFDNLINNYIYIAPTNITNAANKVVYQYSQNNANLYGAEAGVHFHPLVLPFLHIKSTYSKVIAIQDNGDYLPFIPADKLRYEIRFEKKKLAVFRKVNLSLSFLTAFKQNKVSVFEKESEAYTLFNIGLYSKLKISKQILILGISVNNVLDTQYRSHLSTLNYYNQGRNISFSCKIPFMVVH